MLVISKHCSLVHVLYLVSQLSPIHLKWAQLQYQTLVMNKCGADSGSHILSNLLQPLDFIMILFIAQIFLSLFLDPCVICPKTYNFNPFQDYFYLIFKTIKLRNFYYKVTEMVLMSLHIENIYFLSYIYQKLQFSKGLPRSSQMSLRYDSFNGRPLISFYRLECVCVPDLVLKTKSICTV